MIRRKSPSAGQAASIAVARTTWRQVWLGFEGVASYGSFLAERYGNAPADVPRRPRVAVVFGGRSSEHSISCATAGGVLGAIDALAASRR